MAQPMPCPATTLVNSREVTGYTATDRSVVLVHLVDAVALNTILEHAAAGVRNIMDISDAHLEPKAEVATACTSNRA